jgi:hypothetical protein
MTEYESARLVGITSTALSIAIPILLWFLILRPWKPKARWPYAIRFALWPVVVFCFLLGGPVAREIFGVRATYQMTLTQTLTGLLGIWLLTGLLFFGIGWIRGGKLGHGAKASP